MLAVVCRDLRVLLGQLGLRDPPVATQDLPDLRGRKVPLVLMVLMVLTVRQVLRDLLVPLAREITL